MTRARSRIAGLSGLPAAAFTDRIRTADALDDRFRWPAGAWILANPPWVSFSGRRATAARGSNPTRGPGGWPALHSAFLARIAHHVGTERTGAAVLVPAGVAELAGYGPLRRAVTRWATLAAPPEELGEAAFPGVIEPAVLLRLSPAPPGASARGSAWTGSSPEARVLERDLAPFPRLAPKTFADPGVHTGNSAKELVLPAHMDRWPALRSGRDLRPFRLAPGSARLRTDLERGADRRFRIPPLEHLRSFPVLLRQTADRPLAAMHSDPGYFRNSLLAARAVEGLAPEVLVAVLNSGLVGARHRLLHIDARQRAFPQVKVRHLAGIPFPISNRAEDPRLHDRLVEAGDEVERIDALLADAFGLDADAREIVARVGSHQEGASPRGGISRSRRGS